MSTAIQCGNIEEVVRITESLAFNGGGKRGASPSQYPRKLTSLLVPRAGHINHVRRHTALADFAYQHLYPSAVALLAQSRPGGFVE